MEDTSRTPKRGAETGGVVGKVDSDMVRKAAVEKKLAIWEAKLARYEAEEEENAKMLERWNEGKQPIPSQATSPHSRRSMNSLSNFKGNAPHSRRSINSLSNFKGNDHRVSGFATTISKHPSESDIRIEDRQDDDKDFPNVRTTNYRLPSSSSSKLWIQQEDSRSTPPLQILRPDTAGPPIPTNSHEINLEPAFGRPTFIRLSRKHVSHDTLRLFNLDYEIDTDPSYFLVKEWISHSMQEAIFRHTALIRLQRPPTPGVATESTPTYTRMARRHLSLETLRHFNEDFEVDYDPNYVLIKRLVPESDQWRLWEHTRVLRQQHRNGTDNRGDFSQLATENKPVWTQISLDLIEPESARFFKLPYAILEPTNSMIVKKVLEHEEIRALAEHTRKLRATSQANKPLPDYYRSISIEINLATEKNRLETLRNVLAKQVESGNHGLDIEYILFTIAEQEELVRNLERKLGNVGQFQPGSAHPELVAFRASRVERRAITDFPLPLRRRRTGYLQFDQPTKKQAEVALAPDTEVHAHSDGEAQETLKKVSKQGSRIVGEVAGLNSHRGTGDWFQEMKSFEKLVDASRKEPDADNGRVRVAIFDTGLDLSHPDIQKARSEGRLHFHDFVEKNGTIIDQSGHGTHCASLILKYAPNAELFVGRVFRNNEADNESCGILTEAIRYATSKTAWDVDIISISLGFTFTGDSDDGYHDLQVEIRRASGNTLIFASAANNTTNEVKPIRFPARMQEVFCVFSSDSFGKPSTFNPPARYGRPNFMFPGEKIKGAWPAKLSDNETIYSRIGKTTYKLQSGTSCATPIAAAVAAGVLEFAWQPRESPVRRVKRLKHHSGMSQVFLRHMIDNFKVGDNSYHYVKPWKLISTYRKKEDIPILISDDLDHCDE